MMKGKFKASMPSDIQFTMELTASLGEWKAIAGLLKEQPHYTAGGSLWQMIESMAIEAHSTFTERDD